MAQHPALKYLRFKQGTLADLPRGAQVEPVPGYSFATCADCGCPHWMVITTVTERQVHTGKPPAVAYICRNCLQTLDLEGEADEREPKT
jgi:hypothetical protein